MIDRTSRIFRVFVLMSLLVLFFFGSPQSPLYAISKSALESVINSRPFYNPAEDCDNSSAAASAQTPTTTSPSGSQKGQSLGGVAGTGLTQEEINKVKQAGHGSFTGGSDFLVTTYGPPWDSVEGSGTTSTGVDLQGPDNKTGKPKYVIAVDPNVIPYGSLITVQPNALNWNGPFVAADTGGAIKGNHVDVYDWSGDGTKDNFSRDGGKVSLYTGGAEAPVEQQGQNTSLNSGSCCNSSVSLAGGASNTATLPDTIPEPWKSKIQSFSGKYPDTDPRLVAAALEIENNGWPEYKTSGWPGSSASAQGPFQFIPQTWASMGQDGDGDGVKDPNNPMDAIPAAYIHLKGSAGKPLAEGYDGNADNSFNTAAFRRRPDNLLYFLAAYNGSGAHDGPIKDFRVDPAHENERYVVAAYWLLGSNFTKALDYSVPGGKSFFDPRTKQPATSSSGGINAGAACQSNQTNGEFVFYSQYDPKWKDHKYGDSTIGPSGCGPSSMAMIVATLTKDASVTPDVVADIGTSVGSKVEGGTAPGILVPAVAQKYNLKQKSLASMSEAITAIKSGAYVLVGGTGAVPFTQGGHVIVLRGVTADGKIQVGDPAHPEANTTAYDPEVLSSQIGWYYSVSK